MAYVTRLVCLCAVLYVLAAVSHTSWFILKHISARITGSHLSTFLEQTHDSSSSTIPVDISPASSLGSLSDSINVPATLEGSDVTSFNHIPPFSSWLQWPIDDYLAEFQRKVLPSGSSAIALSESLYLSKSFSNSLHPMKIVPYFYKGYQAFDNDDITVTTLVTINRLHILEKLAARYQGLSHD